jgi:hypothetical protein
MPLAQYGQTSPAGLDPWNIESTLAPLAAAGSSANAQLMLSDYQYQREAANNLYGQDMQAQHDFAQQQLKQQLYEANLKGLAEAKDPSVLEIMANAPGYAGVFGGAGQGAIGDTLARAQQSVAAKNFEAGGKGAEGFSNAGYMPPANSIPGLPAGTVQTENARLAAERLRASATLGAASIRAAGGAGGDRGSYQMPPDPNAPGLIGTEHPNKGESYQQFVARMRAEGRIPGQVQLPPGAGAAPGLPMAQTDTPTNAPPTSPPPLAGKTSLQPKGTAQPVQNTSQGADPIEQKLGNYVEQVVRTQNPTAYADIKVAAAANGNKIQMLRDAKGNIVGIQGAKQKYTQ